MKNLLYNMTAEQARIFELIDEADGELTPEIEAELDKYKANVLGRAFTMKEIIVRFEDKLGLAKKKKKEYDEIRAACENAIKKGREYLKKFMQLSKTPVLTYEADSISLRKTPDAVFVENKAAVPMNYLRITADLTAQHYEMLLEACEFAGIPMPEIKTEVNKEAIKEVYKASKLEIAGTKITSDFTVQFNKVKEPKEIKGKNKPEIAEEGESQ
jgi:hypothetical protein